MTFYSHQILHRKSGKFWKIWMAATKAVKLTRREVASINISQSCNEVLEYINLRVDHDRPGSKHPRLSLYLSTFLMYGIVRIYSKQCEYLLVDAESVFVRVQHIRGLAREIDLQETPRANQVTNPELQTNAEVDFGFYMVLDELDRPDLILPPVETWALESQQSRSSPSSRSSTGVSRKSRSKSRKNKRAELPGSPHTVASIEQITLTERPSILVDTPLSPIPVPKDLELPMMTGQDMDLLGPTDEPRLAVRDLLPASTPIGAQTPDRSTRSRQRAQQTTEESPTIQVQQAVREKTPEPAPPPQEIPPTPPRAAPRSPEITQIVVSPVQKRRRLSRKSLTLDPHVELQGPVRRRHKRQLRFTDPVTQIPKAQIKKNLLSGKDTADRSHVIDFHDVDRTDWLKVPGRREFRGLPLCSLWSRGARFRRNLQEWELPQLESPSTDSSADKVPSESEGARVEAQNETLIATRLPDLETERTLTEDVAQQDPRPTEESIEILRHISATGERLEISEVEMPSVEVARDDSTSRILEPGTLNLSDVQPVDESSKRSETSASKRRSRSVSSRRSSEEMAEPPQPTLSSTGLQTSSLGLGGLYNIVEEPMLEVQAVPLEETEETVHMEEELHGILNDEFAHQTSKKTTFRKLCPTQQATRKQAARMFAALLGICAKGKVKARQKTSFGEIYILKA